MRTLLVEDDTMLGNGLNRALQQNGHTVDWLHDGAAADTALRAQHYDMILLDLGLPKRSGLEVLRALRDRGDATPVLIITARDAVADRVAGLDTGADDYLIKPFALDELEARIRALSRRHHGQSQPLLRCGQVVLDPATRSVTCRDRPVSLSPSEYRILHSLMRRPGAVVSRSDMEERFYGWDEEISSNTIEVHIHRLRQKLGPEVIRTVRGLGYQVVA